MTWIFLGCLCFAGYCVVNYACDQKVRWQCPEHYICSHNCDSICHKNVSHRSSKQSDYQSCWSSCKVSLGRCSIQSSALHARKPRMVIIFAFSNSFIKFMGTLICTSQAMISLLLMLLPCLLFIRDLKYFFLIWQIYPLSCNALKSRLMMCIKKQYCFK